MDTLFLLDKYNLCRDVRNSYKMAQTPPRITLHPLVTSQTNSIKNIQIPVSH